MIEPLNFGKNTFTPTIRMLSDMKDVLYDSAWSKTVNNFMIYYFFRNLYLNEKHKKIAAEQGIQFDMTVIPPKNLGVECTKTKGHYHPKKPGTAVSYPEIYEVLSGEANYLLQKEEDGQLTDVILIKASKGDKVIIPSNYGHITINASEKTLRMANWVCSHFDSDYGSIEKMNGGAYFMLVNGKLIPNMNYEKLPPVRFLQSADLSSHDIEKSKSLYSLINNPDILRFLTHPEYFIEQFVL
jgi:glucose-6-phosphate isomerase